MSAKTTTPTAHRIDLEPAFRLDEKGVGRGQGKARMLHMGRLIGESRQPALDAARYLLRAGLASPDELITTYRDGRPCIYARVGTAAKLSVSEPDRGGLRFVQHRELELPEPVT